jgi:hypothetical protein
VGYHLLLLLRSIYATLDLGCNSQFRCGHAPSQYPSQLFKEHMFGIQQALQRDPNGACIPRHEAFHVELRGAVSPGLDGFAITNKLGWLHR